MSEEMSNSTSDFCAVSTYERKRDQHHMGPARNVVSRPVVEPLSLKRKSIVTSVDSRCPTRKYINALPLARLVDHATTRIILKLCVLGRHPRSPEWTANISVILHGKAALCDEDAYKPALTVIV